MEIKMAEIITLGETMAVMAPSGEGRLSSVESFGLRIADAESNTAVGAVRLGHTAAWISAVGDDELGRYVVSEIEREGVDVSLVKTDPAHRTGLMIKEIIGGATNVYYYRENSAASRISPEDIPFEKLSDAKIVHITGITPVLGDGCRDAVYSLIAWARENGKTVSFDPNIRRKIWKGNDYTPLLRELISMSDIALAGFSELRELYGADTPLTAARALLSAGVKYAVVKDGGNGAWCASGEDFIFIPPVLCSPIDPVGAGDGFNAGFLSGMLEGKSLAECGKMGAVVGAMATETVGDVNGYPTRKMLEERIRCL